jgi:dihydrofolate synthase/folylpolyglutamate synthase
LAGEHQVANARTAVAALRFLKAGAIAEGIAAVRWPGRLEFLAENILADGAHNPAGARALAAYLERFHSRRRITLIYGAMRDKAVAEMAGILFPLAARVIVTAPRQARAVHPATLAGQEGTEAAADLPAALAQAGGADLIVITGSLFLVAEARELL